MSRSRISEPYDKGIGAGFVPGAGVTKKLQLSTREMNYTSPSGDMPPGGGNLIRRERPGRRNTAHLTNGRLEG